ncbi:FHA domain-containing protein FhaB/FipA [Knoellia aerolata]|uniref:Signal peptide protein n=1 Tax=Knoellia aerolata DSM 18566 TaxID=1385519 RepID=A0A0A0JW68_9MICO|nr:FHA domain-containing protein [Knoellia aerolata]KGN41650.1 signal peptide protein [Knoellia aerolata DSM 18566]
MTEITITIMRLGLLVALWAFVIAVVGVLRGDLYGTQVTPRRPAPPRAATPRPAARGSNPAAVPAEQRPVPRPAARRFTTRSPDRDPSHLRVTSGPLAGTSLPLREAGILIGRSPESALVLDDDFASGRHARIYKGPEGWVVEDLGSTNGTFIGPMRLSTPTPVTAGTEIRFGTTVVELRR